MDIFGFFGFFQIFRYANFVFNFNDRLPRKST